MSAFDTVIMLDWSGGNDTGPAPRRDAIWCCLARGGQTEEPVYLRNRQLAEAWVGDRISEELAAGRRALVGFDFPFGYPEGFAQAVCGSANPLDLWAWLADTIEDAPDSNNRFDVAGEVNLRIGDGCGPFWGNALQRDIPGLARNMHDYVNPFPDKRTCEALAAGAFTCWQLAYAGAVGSQVLMGLPVLHRLRLRFRDNVAVWPFEPLNAPVAFVEIWPSLTLGGAPEGMIRDAWQVQEVARNVSRMPAEVLTEILDVSAPEEGWILGVGSEELLRAAVPAPVPEPPPLRNDCFALPAGIDWIPVDEALDHLRRAMPVRVGRETVPLEAAAGRILAEDLRALRSNPPHANTAVDGYGFAGGRDAGTHVLPLVEERAAAGDMAAPVPAGHAIRVLTGAALPEGVESVILQEDVTEDAGQIAFRGPLKAGANTRRAGEDVAAGDVVLKTGRRLTPADLALAAVTGHGVLPVRERLKVGVISTGDELRAAGEDAGPGQIFDANRPMLLSLLAGWDLDPVDLGRVPDDREKLRDAFDRGAAEADVILTSGGASAGDEDHVSALLRGAGAMEMWRIAVKPGRPLALGLWKGCPVFGLPGNPVAALVCALIFARPALGQMAGRGWRAPEAMDLPAGFSKSKKPGRREFLRARLREGRVEIFASEGSGRISGLSWAEGLVELPDGALEVRPGDPVRYLPFSQFGF